MFMKNYICRVAINSYKNMDKTYIQNDVKIGNRKEYTKE